MIWNYILHNIVATASGGTVGIVNWSRAPIDQRVFAGKGVLCDSLDLNTPEDVSDLPPVTLDNFGSIMPAAQVDTLSAGYVAMLGVSTNDLILGDVPDGFRFPTCEELVPIVGPEIVAATVAMIRAAGVDAIARAVVVAPVVHVCSTCGRAE